jgi:hypothetical protein
MVRYLLISLLLVSFTSCKKDHEKFVTGVLLEKSGCFGDSCLLAINNPDFSNQPFLRSTGISSCVTCYNCSNAVFLSLHSSFSNTGNMIEFFYNDTQDYCLSSSGAPAHITVKNCPVYKFLQLFRIFGV